MIHQTAIDSMIQKGLIQMPNLSTLPVGIITMDLTVTPPVEEQTRVINFAKPSDRKWLEKHMFWAVYNGRGIAFNPTKNDQHLTDIYDGVKL